MNMFQNIITMEGLENLTLRGHTEGNIGIGNPQELLEMRGRTWLGKPRSGTKLHSATNDRIGREACWTRS